VRKDCPFQENDIVSSMKCGLLRKTEQKMVVFKAPISVLYRLEI
jgi:hypothetical protein